MNLNELKKDELISIIQDYQEMVSDIESIMNKEMNTIFTLGIRDRIREVIYKNSGMKDTSLGEFLLNPDWDVIFDPYYGRKAGEVINICDPCPPTSNVDTSFPSKKDVKKIVAIKNGINDESNWLGVFELKDGRYLFAGGWCDYTGWDCQGGTSHEVSYTLEDLLQYGLNESQRKELNL